ncbi:hypothetical protein BO70DRAFT_396373 [Aspergillus heteromorphus CBS 117.55]|uniref:F-box domain-containing protein n=1 Tax=Aspergillus heteromorphus CBS 117.55 TaxID=1448321 RepID=A0A317W8M0_9EURO|nr:uncharacterized protein BO70DRAFT_396373 [Aspergillus heteromorphus CBS 117.55]PWY82081.1 hypothetical protein BO70DRAFT_396373 [Aspergillus heteromorphus CBS 117.55]
MSPLKPVDPATLYPGYETLPGTLHLWRPENPLCQICNGWIQGFGKAYSLKPSVLLEQRLSWGFHSAWDMEEMNLWYAKTWQTVYRMILYDPATREYRLSGTCQEPPEIHAGDYLVPHRWYEGVVWFPRELKAEFTDRLANPVMLRANEDPEKMDRLVGYTVHALCWKMLEKHLGRYLEYDVQNVSRAVRLRFLKMHSLPHPRAFELTNLISADTRTLATRAVPLLIKKATPRRKGPPQILIETSDRAVYSRLNYLPLELQYLIMDRIPPEDALRIQRALRWSLPDAYWRSRINSKVVFEVRSCSQLTLNWQYLCLKLEELEAKDTVRRLYSLPSSLKIRAALFKHLDLIKEDLAEVPLDGIPYQVELSG